MLHIISGHKQKFAVFLALWTTAIDKNLPGILNQWDLKHSLPGNLNNKNNPIITYKFSKTLGQMKFNYNLILKKFDKDGNWKPVCNCEQFLSFVNSTYKHIITGDLEIIKQLDLQSIMEMGLNSVFLII